MKILDMIFKPMSRIGKKEKETVMYVKVIFFALYSALMILGGFYMYENIHSEGWIQHKFCADYMPESMFQGRSLLKNITSTFEPLNIDNETFIQ